MGGLAENVQLCLSLRIICFSSPAQGLNQIASSNSCGLTELIAPISNHISSVDLLQLGLDIGIQALIIPFFPLRLGSPSSCKLYLQNLLMFGPNHLGFLLYLITHLFVNPGRCIPARIVFLSICTIFILKPMNFCFSLYGSLCPDCRLLVKQQAGHRPLLQKLKGEWFSKILAKWLT